MFSRRTLPVLIGLLFLSGMFLMGQDTWPPPPVPTVTDIVPAGGYVGDEVTIRGTNFGFTQGTSAVTFNGVDAGAALSWADQEIRIKVPTGATSGPVVVTVNGNPSNSFPFSTLTSGARVTYTDEGDFNQGTLINLQILPDATNHHLKILDTGKAFNFIWVAASARGTVIKMDTVTGEILGEYRTAPQGMATNPSRTTVDANGNVWVGNRDESTGGQGAVTMIGLAENGQCGPSPNTSAGLGDILPWPNTGGADTGGGVSTAEDDCILHFVRTPGTGVRTMAIDGTNDLWTGGLSNRVHARIDTGAGTVVAGTAFNLGCGGYGGLIDGNGILWSSSANNYLLRYNASTSTGACLNLGRTSYGLGIDSAGNIWVSNWTSNTVQKRDPSGNLLAMVSTGGSSSRGVAVTGEDDVWIANSGSNTVTRLSNAGALLATIPVGSTPTGVSVDAAGKVWVTNLGSHNVMRIDPSSNAVDLTVSLGAGAGPYNYSDMTGSTLTAAPSTGTWTVTHDSGIPGTPWGSITWNDEPEGATPGDSQLGMEARSSDDGTTWSAWESVSYGVAPAVPNGQFLQVRVTFIRAGTGESPILSDLSITAGVTEIEVFLDILPNSCPNALNVGEKTVLPAAILGTADFDVTQIDPVSILLVGVSPLWWDLEDVATPYTGGISDPPDPMDCTTEGPDGFMDLTLKFDRQEIIAALGYVDDRDVLVVTLTGELLDGTPLVGQDVIWVIK